MRTFFYLSVLLILVGTGCHRSGSPGTAEPDAKAHATPWTTPKFADKPVREETGTATWYPVAPDSIPALRAFPGEFTAAHDTLPLGTYVRVTNLANNRNVIVRITDRGIGRKSTIDLSDRAAEALGILEKGETKVRLSILEVADKNAPQPTGSVAF